MRTLLALTGAAAMTLALVPVAAADAPTFRGTYDNGYETFVDTEVCAAAPWGFDVDATEHEYGTYLVWLDAAGNFVKAIVHSNYDASISANGNTIVERDTWTDFFAPNGSRSVGLTVHIQGPGGIVVRDAGQIVRDASGNPLYIRGPHEQFSGVSFCPALAR
jgi:hypothetical protein